MLPVSSARGGRMQALHGKVGCLMLVILRCDNGLSRRGGEPLLRPAGAGMDKTRLWALAPTAARTLSQQATSRGQPGRPLQRREPRKGSTHNVQKDAAERNSCYQVRFQRGFASRTMPAILADVVTAPMQNDGESDLAKVPA